MKISFYGAAQTVTGSCYYIETDKCRFIIDCGMFQGFLKEDILNQEPFPFKPSELDFALLTHAHIDHTGRIPKLYIDGFKGEIITTKATTELCSIMLPDSGHIQEFENEWQNRKRQRAGRQQLKPLYTMQDAIDCMKLFRSVRYNEIVTPCDGVKVRFNDAGHILGSSIIELWITEKGEEVKLVFSGDLGNKNIPILRDPTIIESADYLIIESTYGNRLHKDIEKKVDKLLDIINSTVAKGGNIVIPSFAVGRTQEIIYELHSHRKKYGDKVDKFMSIPVFVDSPLAVNATKIFRENLDCYDEEARKYVENGDNPLDFPGLQFTQGPEESKALNNRKDSIIIISASGMCDAGRIKHHLKHNLWRKESSIVFVGYQAQGTLGRKLVDGAKKVKIFGEDLMVNAGVEMIEGFSGHADKAGLLEWIDGFKEKPSKVFVVHGEGENVTEFAKAVNKEFGIETFIPSRGESFLVEKSRANAIEVRMEAKEVVKTYTRLEILYMLDKIRAELDEATEIVRNNMKKESDDKEIELLKEKLRGFEKSILELIK